MQNHIPDLPQEIREMLEDGKSVELLNGWVNMLTSSLKAVHPNCYHVATVMNAEEAELLVTEDSEVFRIEFPASAARLYDPKSDPTCEDEGTICFFLGNRASMNIPIDNTDLSLFRGEGIRHDMEGTWEECAHEYAKYLNQLMAIPQTPADLMV